MQHNITHTTNMISPIITTIGKKTAVDWLWAPVQDT